MENEEDTSLKGVIESFVELSEKVSKVLNSFSIVYLNVSFSNQIANIETQKGKSKSLFSTLQCNVIYFVIYSLEFKLDQRANN